MIFNTLESYELMVRPVMACTFFAPAARHSGCAAIVSFSHCKGRDRRHGQRSDAISTWNYTCQAPIQKGIVMPFEKPIIDVGYTAGGTGYRYHDGGPTDAPDWPAFLELAAKYFKTE